MSSAALTEVVFEAAAARDMRAATDAVRDALAQGQPVGSVLAALAAVQVRVGERWYSDQWSVADEHAATAIVDAALAVVEGSLGPDVGEGGSTSVVVTCPEGEWHALPARMLATDLRSLGTDVVFLGSSMPADHLARYLDAHRPDVVALSVSTALSLGAAATAIDAAHGVGIPVVVGGRALGTSEHRARALGADGWSPDASGLLARDRFGSTADAVARRRERELVVLQLEVDRPSLVDATLAAMADRVPAMSGFDERQLAQTRLDVDYIARFAEASILVDDTSLFGEFIDWLRPLLLARRVPAAAVDASLEVLIDVSTDAGFAAVVRTAIDRS